MPQGEGEEPKVVEAEITGINEDDTLELSVLLDKSGNKKIFHSVPVTEITPLEEAPAE